jgi:predicted transcriptional regulator
VRFDKLKIKWRNENLRFQLRMNILDYVNHNKNTSITNLADYTNQEYIVVAAIVDELINEGLIKSKNIYRMNTVERNEIKNEIFL